MPNYPYIEFWHQLDIALQTKNLPDPGPELIGDQEWQNLFNGGVLIENNDIYMKVVTAPQLTVRPEQFDQLGNPRPAGSLSDIGSIEIH
ncbi:hypothetical protein ACFL1Z_08085 [Thermodesulfobacteriota bacterium]